MLDDKQDVRGTTGDEYLGYTDEALQYRPGEGFEWTFEMSEDGIRTGYVHDDTLEVCPDRQVARYSFPHQEAGGGLLVVQFDYTG